MGRMSRTKGAAGEREFAALLSEALGKDIKRKLGAARDGGDDIVVEPFSFEVKRRETLSIEDWLAQAIENAAASSTAYIPVVAYRKNGNKEWRVVLEFKHFIPLLMLALNNPTFSNYRGPEL
jgi:hypothetical protein